MMDWLKLLYVQWPNGRTNNVLPNLNGNPNPTPNWDQDNRERLLSLYPTMVPN